ncbi:hypothetical protein QJS10_CPB18g01991 [Acorus calamus]|uniref:Leucine-rich repeat-containing N-terminal plant-type domain-containing protein n=1 Tax=Acorus calamus TaxID=4465 RepID=A0AAV9CPD4_ACOCL|nr:hypothetical protein QJS10_CPB18g01991 [Acorus calamus]
MQWLLSSTGRPVSREVKLSFHGHYPPLANTILSNRALASGQIATEASLKKQTSSKDAVASLLNWKASLVRKEALLSWTLPATGHHHPRHPSPCKWSGITCNHKFEVREIILPDSGLEGMKKNVEKCSIPPNSPLNSTRQKIDLILQEVLYLNSIQRTEMTWFGSERLN